MRIAVRLFLLWLLSASGCGLGLAGRGSASGDHDAAASSGDGGTEKDATSGGSSGGSTGSSGGASSGSSGGAAVDGGDCLASIPSGWMLVDYQQGMGSCPAPLGTQTPVESDPVISPSACSCPCQVQGQPSCNVGTLNISAGAVGCDLVDFSIAADGGCGGPSSAVPGHLQANVLDASGGTGQATPTPDPSGLQTTPGSLCAVLSSDMEGACAGSLPAGVDACIMTSGTAACPTGTPFANRHVVAGGFVLSCSCGPVSVTATCSSASITLYPNGCGNTSDAITIGVNGSCNSVNGNGATGFNGATYEAQMSNPSCSAIPQSGFEPMNLRTVCCR